MENQKPQYYDGSGYIPIQPQTTNITVIKPELSTIPTNFNPDEKPCYYDGSQSSKN